MSSIGYINRQRLEVWEKQMSKLESVAIGLIGIDKNGKPCILGAPTLEPEKMKEVLQVILDDLLDGRKPNIIEKG